MEFLNTFESILYFGKIVKINLVFMKKYSFSVLFLNFIEKLYYTKKRQHSLNSNKTSVISATFAVAARKKKDKKHEKTRKTHFLPVFHQNLETVAKLNIF